MLLPVCQPIHYAPLSSSGLLSEGLPNDHPPRIVVPRQHQPEFIKSFQSDKLDLVFILDTGPGMKSFYQNNPFGSGFLNRFKNYDWKVAYTDMSVDVQALPKKKEQKETQGNEKGSCDFLFGVGMTAAGIVTDKSFIFSFGFARLLQCIALLDFGEENKQTNFANGVFLPFEHNGEKMELGHFHQLTASVENYDSIFDHSFRLGSASDGSSGYEAPEQKTTESYPFLAMVFSLVNGRSHFAQPSQNQKSLSFFRKDSLIVYVLVTIRDMQSGTSEEEFKKGVKTAFGSDKRVKLIPVILSSDSHMFCKLKLQNTSSDSSKLKKLASQLGNTPIDICSPNLADKLFNEISKSLYKKNLLSN